MRPTHGSLFTGVGGFDLGFAQAGIETLWMVEYDAACQAVLRYRFPGIPLYGDIREVEPRDLPPVDVISFGSPCQGLSVAGQQRGLHGDERSNLFYEAIRIIQGVRPAIAVWENVPGAFSSDRGRDFAAVLDALADIGAVDIGWRVLDSRFFGVAQRRRRVFLVADFGGRRAGEILALADGVRRHTPKGRTKGQVAAASAEAGADCSRIPGVAGPLGNPSGGGVRQDLDGMTYIPEIKGPLIPHDGPLTTYWDGGQMMPEKRRMPVVLAFDHKQSAGDATDDLAPTLRATPHDTTWANGGGNTAIAFYHTNRQPEFGNRYDESPTLKTSSADGGIPPAVATFQKVRRAQSTEDFDRWEARDVAATLSGHDLGGDVRAVEVVVEQQPLAFYQQAGESMSPVTVEDISPTISSGGSGHSPNKVAVSHAMRVRRLTPRECERLQGFPDDWTLVPYRHGKPMVDSQRYRQMGNAVTVNVTRWLGQRIAEALDES